MLTAGGDGPPLTPRFSCACCWWVTDTGSPVNGGWWKKFACTWRIVGSPASAWSRRSPATPPSPEPARAVPGIFLEIFEEIVRRCLEAELVEGQRLTVDRTAVTANASSRSKVHRKQWAEVAQVARTVREYLAEVTQENPVADTADRPFLLPRSLPDRQRPLHHPGGGSYSSTLPAGDVGNSLNATAGESELRYRPKEFRGGQRPRSE